MTLDRLFLVSLLGLAAAAACGCSSLSATTRVGAHATTVAVHGLLRASAATTNASVTEPDMPRYAEAAAFLRNQRPLVAREAARGGGEHIDALALLLNDADGAALGRWMQRHYAGLFGGPPRPARALVQRLATRAG